MNPIDRLTELFSHFPGIGPRQARRFTYYLLSRNEYYKNDLIAAIQNLKVDTAQCERCMRFYPKNNSDKNICSICANPQRDASVLMIVPRDADLEAMERSGGFKGLYFVLGGSLPILEKEPEKRIRIHELLARITADEATIKELILAMNATSEGENTAHFIKDELSHAKVLPMQITTLGRGLSTGAELEYADPDTLKNALLHRTK